MANNLFRKYNQNRKTIWTVIIFVAFFVILLQTVFAIIRSSKNKEREQALEELNKQKNSTQINEVLNNEQNNITVPNTGASSSQNRESYRKTAQIELNKFVQYCNNGQIQEAYEMITSDCKQILFPTLQDFNNNYVQKIFTQKRTIKVENSMYGESIYKVSYYEDILSNGGYGQSNTLQDYVRIERTNEGYKFSFNKFLYLENIEKNENANLIYMKALQKQVYIDFEIYQIQITNNTQNTILISTRQEENSVYIVDEKEVTYPSNMDEQAIERLIVKPGATTMLNIKFNKMYNPERKINAIRFVDIVSDYEKYQRGEEVEKIKMNIKF
ncbi:MAG: hypothetical protein HFJ28_02215 [Clostridia bacterium]|jgi:hypothetical protein|nr:hypothetical protein [Clostridia bacterium]